MKGTGFVLVAWMWSAGLASGQTPQPFPRPGGQPPPVTVPPAPAPQPAPAQVAVAEPATPSDPNAPSATTLGLPVYPGAQFLTSYDAGKGQRFYLFGSTASFSDLVTYYRAQLKERGDLVYEEPPTHMFEVGRFRQETMAFPPGVTIKDHASGGAQGYPNPRLGAQPPRFPSIIMIVPAPPGEAR